MYARTISTRSENNELLDAILVMEVNGKLCGLGFEDKCDIPPDPRSKALIIVRGM